MNFLAFTLKLKQRTNVIQTPLGISELLPENENIDPNNDPRIFNTLGIWDTGATGSAITESTAQSLGLEPIGFQQVQFGSGIQVCKEYLVNFYLPNRSLIRNVKVTECANIAGGVGALIGMDVITLGDFVVTNQNNETTVSFRIPSLETIDYVKSWNKAFYKDAKRNDKCRCGSGKKFKDCHEPLLKLK